MEKKLFTKTFKTDSITDKKISDTALELNKILGFNISQSSIIRRAIQNYNFKDDLEKLKSNLSCV